MAIHYDATGILVLDKVTPVINALFGDFLAEKLNPDYEGTGFLLSSTATPSWNVTFENLKELARSLPLPLPTGSDFRIEDVLQMLATYFNVADEPALRILIENTDFDDAIDLAALFVIATSFNDGHGLKAIKLGASRRSAPPGFFEFGGDGLYISQKVSLRVDSSLAPELGGRLHAAILKGKLDEGAEYFAGVVLTLLAGVSSHVNRRALQWRLGEYLLRDFLETAGLSR